MTKPYIGRHIGTSNGFKTTVDFADSIGCNFFQIFLASPKRYNFNRRDRSDLLYIQTKLNEKNMKLVIHANYMLNFCNSPDSKIHKSAVKILTNDLLDSILIGAIGVVVHMGKKLKLDEKTAIDNYVNGIKTVLNQTPKESIIILETGAGQGSEICTQIYELGKLYEQFNKDERDRIKFCIDTCHIFAAGYNIGHSNYVDLFCELINTHLSWNKVACIHLNDSECLLNSKKDRHANIGSGCIKIEGLKKFIQICGNKGIPIVLETPCSGDDKNNEIKQIKSWFD